MKQFFLKKIKNYFSCLIHFTDNHFTDKRFANIMENENVAPNNKGDEGNDENTSGEDDLRVLQ